MDYDKISEGYGEGEKPFTFYYNRKERISRAPKIVQDYYAGKFGVTKKGLFKTMFATRANKMLFLSVIIIMLFGFCYSIYLNKVGYSFAGTNVKITSFSFDETVFVGLKLNEKKNLHNFTPQFIDVRISSVDDSDMSVNFYEDEIYYTGKEVEIKTKFPDYNIEKLFVELHTQNEYKKIVSLIKHR